MVNDAVFFLVVAAPVAVEIAAVDAEVAVKLVVHAERPCTNAPLVRQMVAVLLECG